MQKEFRLSDQIYRALFEQTHDGVFIIDLTLKIVAVNPQGANMLGYEVAELIGKSVNDVVALEERLEQDNSNAFPDAGQGPFYERIYRRKDGSTFPVEISMSFVFSAGQAKPYIQSIVRDITERKRWEERLRDSEARNRAIVEAFPDLVIRLQEDGQILEISAGENHPLYFKNENVIGKTMPEIWPRLDDKELRSSLQSLKQSNAPQVFEAIFSEAGNTYEVRLSSIGGGEVLALVRDISDRARLERMKTDFINRASHELRTPVTTAKLMAELIQEGGDQEEIDEFWHILVSELDRQKKLIDRLLMAGRLEENKLLIETNPIELIPIIEESIESLGPIAREKNIQVSLDVIDPPLPLILGDLHGLEQVFINLINNAIKFSPRETTISVTARQHDGKVLASVQDHGMGIPKDELPYLFRRFFRARNVTVAEIPGSGVGLYLIKAIVEEVGGTLHVDTEEGKGSTFTVALHQAKEAQAQPTK
jgi:PAS domain S-box-containing protein